MDKKIIIAILVITAALVVTGIIYGISTTSNKTTDKATGQITKEVTEPQQVVRTDSCPCGCGGLLYGPDACSCPEAEKARS